MPQIQEKVKIATVGLGHWGPAVARNFNSIAGCELVWCCEQDPERRDRWRAQFPATMFTDDLDEVLSDPEIDAVALTTPVPTHAPLAERVLEAGKDCFVEKPLADSREGAERLYELASERDAMLMAGHLLEYHPAVRMIREMLTEGDLGKPRYIYTQRTNLGQLRRDENALWSLGPHDISVVLALVGETPEIVSASGEAYVNDGVEDVVFGFMRFASGVCAHMHLSWLDPHKERRITVVGSQRMATFDDMAPEQKLTVYDKGFDRRGGIHGEYIARSGETRSPAIPTTEVLRIECEHFIDCVRTRERPRSDGLSGLAVVCVLEAMQASLEQGGLRQRVDPPTRPRRAEPLEAS